MKSPPTPVSTGGGGKFPPPAVAVVEAAPVETGELVPPVEAVERSADPEVFEAAEPDFVSELFDAAEPDFVSDVAVAAEPDFVSELFEAPGADFVSEFVFSSSFAGSVIGAEGVLPTIKSSFWPATTETAFTTAPFGPIKPNETLPRKVTTSEA